MTFFDRNTSLYVWIKRRLHFLDDKYEQSDIEYESCVMENAKLAKNLVGQTDFIICTSKRMYQKVSDWNRNTFPCYFEVYLADGSEYLREAGLSVPDLVMKHSNNFSADELATIILVEQTEFCARLRNLNGLRTNRNLFMQ